MISTIVEYLQTARSLRSRITNLAEEADSLERAAAAMQAALSEAEKADLAAKLAPIVPAPKPDAA